MRRETSLATAISRLLSLVRLCVSLCPNVFREGERSWRTNEKNAYSWHSLYVLYFRNIRDVTRCCDVLVMDARNDAAAASLGRAFSASFHARKRITWELKSADTFRACRTERRNRGV